MLLGDLVLEYLRENALAYWESMVSRIQRGVCFLTVTSGAGKTTTFNMLTGDIRPSSGTATIAGYDITSDIREVWHAICVYTVVIDVTRYNVVLDTVHR